MNGQTCLPCLMRKTDLSATSVTDILAQMRHTFKMTILLDNSQCGTRDAVHRIRQRPTSGDGQREGTDPSS